MFVSTFMWMTALYQTFALAGIKELIKYRFFVSRLNKIAIASFVCLIVLMFCRRLSPAAKFCSGDHLSYGDWIARFHPHRSKEFLVKMGFILKMYVYVVCVMIVAAIAIGVYTAMIIGSIFA